MNLTAFRHFLRGAISSTFLLFFSPSARADALDNWTTNFGVAEKHFMVVGIGPRC